MYPLSLNRMLQPKFRYILLSQWLFLPLHILQKSQFLKWLLHPSILPSMIIFLKLFFLIFTYPTLAYYTGHFQIGSSQQPQKLYFRGAYAPPIIIFFKRSVYHPLKKWVYAYAIVPKRIKRYWMDPKLLILPYPSTQPNLTLPYLFLPNSPPSNCFQPASQQSQNMFLFGLGVGRSLHSNQFVVLK